MSITEFPFFSGISHIVHLFSNVPFILFVSASELSRHCGCNLRQTCPSPSMGVDMTTILPFKSVGSHRNCALG